MSSGVVHEFISGGCFLAKDRNGGAPGFAGSATPAGNAASTASAAGTSGAGGAASATSSENDRFPGDAVGATLAARIRVGPFAGGVDLIVDLFY